MFFKLEGPQHTHINLKGPTWIHESDVNFLKTLTQASLIELPAWWLVPPLTVLFPTLFWSLTESSKHAVSCRRAIRSLGRVAAFCRMIFITQVFIASGDPGVPLRRIIIFLFDIYLVPLCFHNVLSSLFLLSQRRTSGLWVGWSEGFSIRCVLYRSCLSNRPCPPGASCRRKAGSLCRPPWEGTA